MKNPDANGFCQRVTSTVMLPGGLGSKTATCIWEAAGSYPVWCCPEGHGHRETVIMADSSNICSWKHAFALDNPIRGLIHNPCKILGGLIERGQTVLDIGCGPGTFSIAMARMVGETGKVIAVDVQVEMLQILRKKAAQEGLESRIVTHKSDSDRIGISEKVEFALAFYMIHEVPDAEAFLREIVSLLKPKGKLLIVEPKFHVSASAFRKTLEAAQQTGLNPIGEPKIRFSRSMLFQMS